MEKSNCELFAIVNKELIPSKYPRYPPLADVVDGRKIPDILVDPPAGGGGGTNTCGSGISNFGFTTLGGGGGGTAGGGGIIGGGGGGGGSGGGGGGFTGSGGNGLGVSMTLFLTLNDTGIFGFVYIGSTYRKLAGSVTVNPTFNCPGIAVGMPDTVNFLEDVLGNKL